MTFCQPSETTMRAPEDCAFRTQNEEITERTKWLRKAAFFHREDLLYLKFLIPPGGRVLELGCGNGHLLGALKPSFGVGVDCNPALIAEARKNFPHLTFLEGNIEDEAFLRSLSGPFDVILIVDTLGVLDDCQRLFENLHVLCTRDTRLIVAYFSHLWYPALKLAELLGWRMRQPPQNVLAAADVQALAAVADFELVKSEMRLLMPMPMLGVGRLVNRFLAPLPLIQLLCLRHYSVYRSLQRVSADVKSATIVIPARNERGNIAPAVQRIPRFADDIEIIFVEGHSGDGTWEEINRVIIAYPQYDIKAMRQLGKSKADAVFMGLMRRAATC